MWKSFWRTISSARAHPQGYYWPTMKKDKATSSKIDKCQRHAPIPHMPSETLKPISGPWPFAQWGMDIVGPLPTAPAQKKFMLVATDYFSKWVEAEAYASIKDKDVTKFHRLRNFCSELNIRNSYSTPCYPQSNGQAEATNKTLPKENGWRSYPASCGLIEPHPDDRQETLPSPSHTVWTQSFLPK
ncbi:hypothetical protein AAG906_011629 [Vitis piasezkii]